MQTRDVFLYKCGDVVFELQDMLSYVVDTLRREAERINEIEKTRRRFRKPIFKPWMRVPV